MTKKLTELKRAKNALTPALRDFTPEQLHEFYQKVVSTLPILSKSYDTSEMSAALAEYGRRRKNAG